MRCGREGDTGAEPNEQRAPGIRMQEQGTIRLAFFRDPRRGPAHLETIVELQYARPARISSTATEPITPSCNEMMRWPSVSISCRVDVINGTAPIARRTA